ncbi:serine/threonine-protein phosphatase 7 long form homolog [Apium graveolens]|uniref:serine/threonine-protein phosphatase 7 long form homolog n=1 Tax=Apium graveolens TaxID=4045 RepID=UPI003D7A5130
MRCRHLNPNKETIRLDRRMIPFLQSSGFHGVARLSALQLDWSLLSALVERWRPETHTFHLPMGEVTVTLQDVGVLLGLPIDGRALIADDIPGPGDALLELVASIFGCAPELSRLNGARIPLSFFTSLTPHYLSEDASLDEVRNRTRCCIHPMYLPFLRDLDTCGQYAWGAVVLAFLYRELCKGCKKGKEEVADCLLLLQLWAWERLPTLATIPTAMRLHYSPVWDGQLAPPYGDRWLFYLFFKWEPYSDIIDDLPAYYLTGRHIWRYRGPLLCIFIVETHVPDRVARQFGMVQSIPPVYST